MADGTQSIGRAIRILKAFDDHNPHWELTQLAKATGLNKTTVFRILGSLEAEGLIERTPTGEYQLGSEMIAMGGRAARVNNLRRVAHAHLVELTRTTGETTTLEVPRAEGDEWNMLVIDEVLGRHLVGITQYIGTRLPIHATSTGKAVLAFSDVLSMLDFPLNSFTNKTPISQDDLLAELQPIRERGYMIVAGELEEGLVAIGAPIFDSDCDIKAAISLVGPSVRLSHTRAQELAAQVQQTAEHISHDIGYRGDTP